MPVQFICPECHQLLSVGTRKIGMEVTCPRCQRPIVVPTQEAAAVGLAMRQSLRAPQAEEPLAEFVVYDDVPAIIESAPAAVVSSVSTAEKLPQSTVTRSAGSPPAWRWAARNEFPSAMLLLSRRGVYLQGAILAAVALVAFLAGLAIGYGVAPTAPAEGAAEPAVVQGMVQYADRHGQLHADHGAIVVVIPDEAIPDPKLPAARLRPATVVAAPPAAALEALDRVGGAYARAAGDGAYRVTVPRSGRYMLLIISQNAERAATAGIDEFQLAVLNRYFNRPEQIIGRNQFNWKVEQLGGGTLERSHTFGPAG
jgi:hypothetical protein